MEKINSMPQAYRKKPSRASRTTISKAGIYSRTLIYPFLGLARDRLSKTTENKMRKESRE
jgi:hypothetical protein